MNERARSSLLSQNECNCGVEGKGTTQDEDLTQRFQRPKFQRFQKPKTDGESTLGEFRDLYMLQMFFFPQLRVTLPQQFHPQHTNTF